jgi:iron complex transport system ATP-binding protein
MLLADKQNKALLSTSQLAIGYVQRRKVRFLQKDLNLNLFEGDLVCLIGPNGCGKSTLIRTLAGIQKPLKGEISIMRKDLTTLPNTSRSQLLNTVLTEKTVVDQITVEEIAALGRYNNTNWLGTLTHNDREKISLALEAVKLLEFRGKAYNTISDGEKQRAFIAKALASDAPVLLLDEPTAHLDVANRVEILSLLRHLTRQMGHAVLLSTHELDLALQLADEIWLMLPEGTMPRGTPEEIMHSGLLDIAFGNETVYFNPGLGSFSVRKKYLSSIDLVGKGEKYEITKQALTRLGFSTESHNKPSARIIIEKDHWNLHYNNRAYSGLNLSDTCRLLRRIDGKTIDDAMSNSKE